jgi:hypothetical protein
MRTDRDSLDRELLDLKMTSPSVRHLARIGVANLLYGVPGQPCAKAANGQGSASEAPTAGGILHHQITDLMDRKRSCCTRLLRPRLNVQHSTFDNRGLDYIRLARRQARSTNRGRQRLKYSG